MIKKLIKKILPDSHFHWQNLNERKGDEFGPPTEGRCWFHFDDEFGNCLGFEWNLWSRFCQLGFKIKGCDEDVKAFIAFPPVAFWVNFENRKLNKLLDKYIKGYESKTTEISIFSNSIYWKLWENTHEWSSKTPKWKNGSFDVLNFFLGKNKYSERDIENSDVEIPMPEGSYKGNVRMFESTWKRPRWFANRLIRADVNVENDPIPIPGKGTMSYNCGDDATYSMTCPANSIEEAVGKMVGNTLRTRKKYGGTWKWERNE